VSPFIAKTKKRVSVDFRASESGEEEEVKSEAEQSNDFFELQRGYRQHDVKTLYNNDELNKAPKDFPDINSAMSGLSALVDIQNDVPVRINELSKQIERKKSQILEKNNVKLNKHKESNTHPTKVTSLVLNSNIKAKKGQSTNIASADENFRTEVIKRFDKVEYIKEHNIIDLREWDKLPLYLKKQKEEEDRLNSGVVVPKKVLKIQPPNINRLIKQKIDDTFTKISQNTSYSKICFTSALMVGAMYLQIKSSRRIKEWSVSALHFGFFLFTLFGVSGTSMALVLKYLSDKKARKNKRMIK